MPLWRWRDVADNDPPAATIRNGLRGFGNPQPACLGELFSRNTAFFVRLRLGEAFRVGHLDLKNVQEILVPAHGRDGAITNYVAARFRNKDELHGQVNTAKDHEKPEDGSPSEQVREKMPPSVEARAGNCVPNCTQPR